MATLENPIHYVEDKEEITKELVRDVFRDAVAGTEYEDTEISGIQLRQFPDEAGKQRPFDVLVANGRPIPAFVVTKEVDGGVWWGIHLGVEDLPEILD